MKKWFAPVLCLALLAACSSQPSSNRSDEKAVAQKPAEKPTEEETGRTAFQYMYAAARMWNPDSRPISFESVPMKESTGKGGRSAVWKAVFGSAGRQKQRSFMWSGLAGEDAPERGVSRGREDSWNPANTSAQAWEAMFFKSDSPTAFEVAQGKGGKKLLEKSPELRVGYLLRWDTRTQKLNWHVSYGDVQTQPDLTVIVDATTGSFVKVLK